MTSTSPGRRAAGRPTRRFPVAPVLAVLLPLAAAGGLALVSAEPVPTASRPPSTVALARTDLACPAAQGDARRIEVANPLAAGDVTVRVGGEERSLTVASGEAARRVVAGPAVVTGTDDLAAGLVAARVGNRAAVACSGPSADTWLTGLGARVVHRSRVQLTNPDAGPAIADLTVLSGGGPLDVPALRGLRVAGHSTETIDLAKVVPRRTDLALHLVVQRGRLVPSAWDEGNQLARGPAPGAWLAPQAVPERSLTLLGLTPGRGSRKLVVANGTDNEAHASLRIVSRRSVFTPQGLDELTLPPGSTRTVEVGDVLARQLRQGATGLVLESSQPVTATLRSSVGGRLVVTTPAAALERAATIVPGGRTTVVLAGADRAGTATVRADGGRPREVAVGPRRSVSVRLPRGAAYVEVRLAGTSARAALVTTPGGGPVVLPLVPLPLVGLVPDVRPGLPNDGQ